MAVTPSTMLPIGTQAPDFRLPDVISGQNKLLSDFKSDKGTLIMFICNHCPFVKHIQKGLVSLANDYMPKGMAVVAINSNDVINNPADSPENMKADADRLHYPFAYLFDETQQVAKAYQAACTPDFYLFDKAFKLVYRGQLDDSRPDNGIPVTGKDLRQAMDCLIAENPVNEDQRPSVGCNIKWKP
jgi:peroxiredoxin